MEKPYDCKTFKKLCIGFPATCRNQHMECRLLDLRNLYERERLSKLGKKELETEHKRLQRKIRKIDDYELCDDDISESDKSADQNYVEATPVKRKKSSLIQKLGVRTTERKERKKKQGQTSEEDHGSEEESEFFFTKKKKSN